MTKNFRTKRVYQLNIVIRDRNYKDKYIVLYIQTTREHKASQSSESRPFLVSKIAQFI